LWALDSVEFKGDETLWLTLADDLVRGGHIPLAGLRSSQGITSSPGLGVRALGEWISALSVPDGRPRVAIAWVVGSDVDPGTHLQWQLALGESPLDVSANGIVHSVADLQSEPVISLFTLYIPAGVPSATYPLRARLADPATSQPTLLTLPDGTRAADWSMSRVEVFPAPACSSEEVSF